MVRLDWSDIGWHGWNDLEKVRAHLAAGADPNEAAGFWGPPLHLAAWRGSPAVVAELAASVADVDAFDNGHTALWSAVFHRRPDNARALVEAGADPWRPMMAGWSPAKLSLAGPTPGLFPPGDALLSPGEEAVVALSRVLIATLRAENSGGHSIACVADVTAEEAVRRLAGTVVPEEEVLPVLEDDELWEDEKFDWIVGVTEVIGGCVLSQPWGWHATEPEPLEKVTAGTRAYAMFANPKSGNQGMKAIDGRIVEGDTHPGGGTPFEGDSADDTLLEFLYQGHAEAFCCGYAGLRLTDARPILGPPDLWIRLDPTR